METSVLVEKLPAYLQKEVEDFVDFLIFKKENQQLKQEIKLGFGGGKGIIGHMSDDLMNRWRSLKIICNLLCLFD